MTLYCPFCGKLLSVERKAAYCPTCGSEVTLVIKRECIRQVIINRCGKDCVC